MHVAYVQHLQGAHIFFWPFDLSKIREREREAEEKMYPQVFKSTTNSAPVILGQRKNTVYYWRHR